jgi:hypothetical protein
MLPLSTNAAAPKPSARKILDQKGKREKSCFIIADFDLIKQREPKVK